MLTITETAQTAIRSLSEQAGLPETGGVRLAMDESQNGLQMSLAQEPAEGDQVVGDTGARVFMPTETATLLETQELDAAATPEGTGFSLRAQAS
ncbi:adhesin [Pseudactinotalea sp.]|uniref:adhesin n=1 Tax=Pseudactinotalea sp. TaxID=1926260 RepID=UPI003B3AA10D